MNGPLEHQGSRVRNEPGNIAHRMVGLFMAVIMPLCCCSTQVLGQVVLDDETVMVRAGSCCGGSAVVESTDCDQSTDPHDRCDCVRGHLGGNADTATMIGSLASPSVAHPIVETTFTGIDLRTDPARVIAAANGPPDETGTTPDARRLRRIVILQN
jgi:hypothetical protein